MSGAFLRLLLICVVMLASPLALAIDRDEAAARAREATGGRVLAVDASRARGDPVFLVRVLTPDGEVRVIVIDAETGAQRSADESDRGRR
jgi:hypothetical protein